MIPVFSKVVIVLYIVTKSKSDFDIFFDNSSAVYGFVAKEKISSILSRWEVAFSPISPSFLRLSILCFINVIIANYYIYCKVFAFRIPTPPRADKIFNEVVKL